ncbi:aspartic proteinase [Musa troglodytarum]|uniref:Aspartic proteinase n=1 Tax=Musa troglodytarum TaxID=320322 RepID=A0A9E7FB95_9LILI|nr:aspartic proteinase [Musa troglodytarum]
MGGGKAARRGLLFASLVFAAAISSVSAAVTTPSPKKAKASDASSAVFPIHGDVYPHGLYYVEMNIGDPPKPYFLDVDTGSDLTWIQCDAPCVRCPKGPHPWYRPKRTNLVPCKNPSAPPSTPAPRLLPRIRTAANVTTRSNTQTAAPPSASSSPTPSPSAAPSPAPSSPSGQQPHPIVSIKLQSFQSVDCSVTCHGDMSRCGYNQQLTSPNIPALTDGVLGLGTGKVSVLSQLSDRGATKNVVGHCFSAKGGGYLFFGDDLVPSSRMTWAPMSRIGSRNYYSLGSANLQWGTRSLGVNQKEVVLDTGSTYTYFGFQPYQALLSAVKSDLSKTPLKEVFDDPSLAVC